MHGNIKVNKRGAEAEIWLPPKQGADHEDFFHWKMFNQASMTVQKDTTCKEVLVSFHQQGKDDPQSH